MSDGITTYDCPTCGQSETPDEPVDERNPVFTCDNCGNTQPFEHPFDEADEEFPYR